MSAQSITDKQYLAKVLFTTQKLEQKIVAKKVGISEQTMSKWVNEFGWKVLRNRLLVGKEEVLTNLYEQLEELNTHIKEKPKGERYGNNKEADVLIKLTASIRNLETELAIADIVGAGQRFIKFLQTKGDFETVSEFAELWNDFIQNEIKR
jgi:transposase